jgi:dihydropteroate synthase
MTKDEINAELLSITEKYKQEFSNKFDKSGKPDSLSKNVSLLAEVQDKFVEELDVAKKKYFKENNIFIKTRLNNFAKTCYKDYIDFATTFE